MADIEITAKIPKIITEAIINASSKMPTLGKHERNAYGKYDFVSIDQYYEKIPAIVAEAGLFWRVREEAFQIAGDKIIYTFAFDLFHKDGTILPSYGRITVIHPIQGAQTAGSALSYAEKIFMRTTFKIVTGKKMRMPRIRMR